MQHNDEIKMSHTGIILISVLGIRDILVRIRILGSVPLTNASVFRMQIWKAQKHTDPMDLDVDSQRWSFTSFFKDKKSQRSYKTVEIKVFLLFLLDDGRIRSQIRSGRTCH
jgi:hypothetical protein